MSDDDPARQGPLSGVKVVDISNFLAGPLVSMFLGDFGADIIKVERPDTGDELRFWGTRQERRRASCTSSSTATSAR